MEMNGQPMYEVELETAYGYGRVDKLDENVSETLVDVLNAIERESDRQIEVASIRGQSFHGWPVVTFRGRYSALVRMILPRWESGFEEETESMVTSIRKVGS